MLLVPTGFTLAMITRLSEILSQHYTPKSIRQAINPNVEQGQINLQINLENWIFGSFAVMKRIWLYCLKQVRNKWIFDEKREVAWHQDKSNTLEEIPLKFLIWGIFLILVRISITEKKSWKWFSHLMNRPQQLIGSTKSWITFCPSWHASVRLSRNTSRFIYSNCKNLSITKLKKQAMLEEYLDFEPHGISARNCCHFGTVW